MTNTTNPDIIHLFSPLWGGPSYLDLWTDHCENEGTNPDDYIAAESWFTNMAEDADERRYAR